MQLAVSAVFVHVALSLSVNAPNHVRNSSQNQNTKNIPAVCSSSTTKCKSHEKIFTHPAVVWWKCFMCNNGSEAELRAAFLILRAGDRYSKHHPSVCSWLTFICSHGDAHWRSARRKSAVMTSSITKVTWAQSSHAKTDILQLQRSIWTSVIYITEQIV